MLTDLLLVDNDLSFDHDIRITMDQKSLLQSAIENIKVVYGEIPINDERGNKLYARRMKLTDIDLQRIASCTNAILYDTRIKSVPYIKAVRSAIFGCDITFSMITKDNVQINGSTTISLM